jgi:hypothetical protein
VRLSSFLHYGRVQEVRHLTVKCLKWVVGAEEAHEHLQRAVDEVKGDSGAIRCPCRNAEVGSGVTSNVKTQS